MYKLLISTDGAIFIGKLLENETLNDLSYEVIFVSEGVQKKLDEKLWQSIKEKHMEQYAQKFKDKREDEMWITFYLSNKGHGIEKVQLIRISNFNNEKEFDVCLDIEILEQEMKEVKGMLIYSIYKSVFGKE